MSTVPGCSILNTGPGSNMAQNISGSISSQIEYIVGKYWNLEYNKWACQFYNYYYGFKYHYMSKVNWSRELKKLPRDCDYRYIFNHHNLTFDIVHANPDKKWLWLGVARNSNVTWDIIRANPDLDWDWHSVSRNPNVTWDIIQTNPDKLWDQTEISQNPNITWDIIQANPKYPWNWNPRSRITTKGECPFGIVSRLTQI